MNCKARLTGVVVLLLTTSAFAGSTGSCRDADLVVRNAKIVTMDSKHSVESSMAIRGGRIQRVGSAVETRPCVGSQTSVLDLRGSTVLPGLIDVHTHAVDWALGNLHNDIDASYPAVKSIADIKKAIAAVAARSPKGRWIRGRGWSEAKFVEHRIITRQDLDPVSPDNPVILRQVSLHLVVVNGAALRLAGITRDTADPPGGVIEKDESGEPTGVLKEKAAIDLISPLLPRDTPGVLLQAIDAVNDAALSQGLTTIHDITDNLAAYEMAHERGRLKVRVLVSPIINSTADAENWVKTGVHTGFGDESLKVGAIKMFADGAPTAKTAAVYIGPEGDPKNLGLLIWEPAEMQRVQGMLAAAGWQIETHAMGDRAIDEVLNSYQAITKALGLSQARFRVEHCAISTPAVLQRLHDLHVVVASNPSFIDAFGDRMSIYGPERLRWTFPEKSYFDRGITVAAGSDAPVTPLNPWVGISAAVSRRDAQSGKVVVAEERLSIMQALEMYTINGAYLGFEEKQKGSLEQGKLADFIVVDRDVLNAAPEELKNTKVLQTFIGGELAYNRRK